MLTSLQLFVLVGLVLSSFLVIDYLSNDLTASATSGRRATWPSPDSMLMMVGFMTFTFMLVLHAASVSRPVYGPAAT